MTRRHSLFTRCLAVLLAMVLIASNGSGLALGVQAAETQDSLFNLIASSGAGTDEMRKVLQYADALPVLKAMDVAEVKYEEAPTSATATLEHGKLTVEDAAGGWVPYSATTATDGTKYFAEGANEITGLTVGETAKVKFALALTEYDEVGAAAMKYIADLAAEAANQETILSQLGSENKLKTMKALNSGAISDYADQVESLTPFDLLTEDEYNALDVNDDGIVSAEEENILKNSEEYKALQAKLDPVKAQFATALRSLRFVTSDSVYWKTNAYKSKLLVYAMLSECAKPGGLAHYYQNEDKVLEELEALKTTMEDINKTDGDEEVEAYKEKIWAYLAGDIVDPNMIGDLAEQMGDNITTLGTFGDTCKNAVDWEADEVTIKAALNAIANCKDTTDYSAKVVLYSGEIEVIDDSFRKVILEDIGEKTYPKGSELTAELINGIIAEVEADNAHCDVTMTVDGVDFTAMVGTKLDDNITVKVTIVPAEYYVTLKVLDHPEEKLKVMGNDNELVLPIPEGYTWKYNLMWEDGWLVDQTAAIVDAEKYMDEIATGNFWIVVSEVNDTYMNMLELFVATMNEKLGAGSFVLDKENNSLTMNISLDELEPIAITLVNDERFADAGNIKLNGKDFLYSNDILVSMAALVEALLNDNTFGSERLIALGNGTTNTLLAGDTTITLCKKTLDLTLNLSEIPEQMASVAKGLETVKGYMSFKANDGKMDVSLTMPEKLHELYLTEALATSDASEAEMIEISNQATVKFVNDYFDMFKAADPSFKAFSNTAGKFIDRDLSAFEEYYDMIFDVAKKAEVNTDNMTMSISGNSLKLKDMLEPLGLGGLKMAMNYAIEETLEVNANLIVTNKAPVFKALVIDPAQPSKVNAIDYKQSISTLANSSVVILMGDVDTLTFNGEKNLLDLNGHTVGSVVANGKLIIVDSSLGTTPCGTVNAISGNATILGGNYPNNDVTGMLKDGYTQVGGVVQHKMYTINGGNITINKDFFTKANMGNYKEKAMALAADIAVDLALNGYRYGALSVNGNTLFAAEYVDLMGTVFGDSTVDSLINQTVAAVNKTGISALANEILDILLNFEAMAEAVNSAGTIATFTVTGNVWEIADLYVKNDLITTDLRTGSKADDFTKKLNVPALPDDIKNYAYKALVEMGKIDNSDIEVTLSEVSYGDKTLSAKGSATVTVDMDLTAGDYYDYYIKAIAVAVKKGDIDAAKALYAQGSDAVKDEFDKGTVKAVLEQLEDVTYAQVAELAAKANNETVDEYMAKYADEVKAAVAKVNEYATKALNRFEGNALLSKTIGSLDSDDDGVYEWSGSPSKSVSKGIKGYTVALTVEKVDVTAKINIFNDCLWGDADHDGKVNSTDARLIMQYRAGYNMDEVTDYFCTARTDVNRDGKINSSDARLVMQYRAGIIKELPHVE